jgi:hypothetical protein
LSFALKRLILGDRDFSYFVGPDFQQVVHAPSIGRHRYLIVKKILQADWERYLADLEQQWAPFLAERTQRKLKKPARKPRRR